MATAFSFDKSSTTEESTVKYEEWLCKKLKSTNNDQNIDVSIFTSYILSILSEEDNTEEEKSDAIRPILEELNENSKFQVEDLLKEIIQCWNNMKDSNSTQVSNSIKNDSDSNPTDAILNMINKHKTQTVETGKTASKSNNDYTPAPMGSYNVQESDDEDDNDEEGLFANNNLQKAQAREKEVRDKLAETHIKQREQTKKALEEQKQREEEKKKKAQQKVAKVERKR